MDDQRIEDILRVGPPDRPRHRQGTFARALAERERRGWVGRDVRRPAAAAVIARPRRAGDRRGHRDRGHGFLVIGRPDSGATTPPYPVSHAEPLAPVATSASPSPSASVGAGGTRGAPVELVDRWVGPVRSIPSLEEAATRAFLVIQGADSASMPGPDSRRTCSAHRSRRRARTSCVDGGDAEPWLRTFDAGRYRWSLSPGARRSRSP